MKHDDCAGNVGEEGVGFGTDRSRKGGAGKIDSAVGGGEIRGGGGGGDSGKDAGDEGERSEKR